MANIAVDKFTRNEILTSNEIRQIIGFKPSDDPKADKLINSNISQAKEDIMADDQPTGDIVPNSLAGSFERLLSTPISELMNK